jgi:hypothetical protein
VIQALGDQQEAVMTIAKIHSRPAVLRALQECKLLGEPEFLEKYGFGRARRYFLVYEGVAYPAKAIIGVAYGYEFPEDGPLTSSNFTASKARVREKLEELGFQVEVQAPA